MDSSSLNITYPLLPAKDFEEIETDDEDNDKDKSQQKNESTNSNKSSEEYIFEEHCADPNDDNNGMLFSNVLFWIMFVITLPIIYAALCGKTNEQIRNKADCSAFLNMSQFQNQDKMLWKSLKSGIEGSFNEKPTRPSIFALFSNDKDTLISIMSKIVEITHRCTYSNENPIILTKTDLWTEEFQEDHSKLILKFKDELEKRKIMIINDVDKLPITVIPSLHSFCDIYNPLVDKSIIFLTIHVPQEPPGKTSFKYSN